MYEKFVQVLEENGKVILAALAGLAIGGFFIGGLSGLSIIKGNNGLGLIMNQNSLPESVDITGDWVYVAETNGKDIAFSEDKCRKRSGTVYINQQRGSYEISLTGERKIKEDCPTTNASVDVNLKEQVIPWNSQAAAVLVNDQKMLVWFKTEDEVSRYGHISATIKKTPNDIKPTAMQGEMYYLNDSNKTWFRAKIYFYRSGSPEAKSIEKKFP